ncbi:MAG: acetate--CoA ligase family protein [Candidatus Moraniibacteriota bacterium]
MRIDTLFSPKSIAIIGASTRPGSVGYTLTENLLKNGYAGTVCPVNPKTDRLFDLPCYKNISAVPCDIDLAIIIVPAASVPAVLRETGAKGIRAAVIISSGFKETGAAGKALEDEVAAIARKSDIALLGPNCLGFLRPSLGLNASFASRMPQDGSIAFFSQSGALCTAMLDLTIDSLGFSHFASIGNKAVIDENELLRFFADEKNVDVIGFYTEGLVASAALIKTGRSILASTDAKPVIALKSGATEAGTRASSSHTGALAGSDAAYDALFRQARILRVASIERLISLLAVVSRNPIPKSGRLAIITNAGGLGVLATDSAVAHGLTIAELAEISKEKLKSALPPAASAENPVDVLGDALADRYRSALEIVAADTNADMLLVIVTPQTMTQAEETAEVIADTRKRFPDKPIVAVFAGSESLQDGVTILKKNGIATVAYPESGTEALAGLAQIAAWREQTAATPFVLKNTGKEKAAAIIAAARHEHRTSLTEQEAGEVLTAYGFPMFAAHTVKNKEEALAAAKKIGKNVALKIISPDIIHKSDVGGVLLDIAPENADDAYKKLLSQVRRHVPRARLIGALVVEMAEKRGGTEIILGLKKEPSLGTLVLAGLGGIFVEIFKDTALRFAPLTREDAEEMLRELKSFPLLKGARGQAGVHMATLVDMIGRLSQLATDFPEIAELDINPVLAFPESENFRVLDARITLEQK